MLRPPFKDRKDAGEKLAERLLHLKGQDCLVLAIPRGGVPVGSAIAQTLGAPLDLIIPRKLPIPYEPEAGFGAISEDGSMVLNEPLVKRLGISQAQIDAISQKVLKEVRRRLEEYRGGRAEPDLKGKVVILVDDGLASGYTMLAAIKEVKRKEPRRIIVAVPCSPLSSIELVEPEVDEVVCLKAIRTYAFAVASFYETFEDLTDDEVKWFLKKGGKCPCQYPGN